MGLGKRALRWVSDRFGGPARARVIVLLAAVLGLQSADMGAVGAMSTRLEEAFGIGQTKIGLLVTVSTLVGAIATLLFGWLTDRTNRTRMLWIVILLWAAGSAASACAISYTFLLVARLALGGASAASVPAVASLVGDFFPRHERGRVFGSVLAGEFVGTGIGFLFAGELAAWSWRAGFGSLAVLAVVLALFVRKLPEPARGGAGQLRRGQRDLASHPGPPPESEAAIDSRDERPIRTAIRRAGIEPREKLVLDRDPRKRSLWWAIGYVLRIPTNLVLIAASALGYYFFAGFETFGIEFFRGQYQLSQSAAVLLALVFGAGALAGVLVGGRLADAIIRRGHLNGRVEVATVAYLASAACFVPGLLTHAIWLAIVAYLFAAFLLGAVNPPLDAARLDIMHSLLWGRAESVRLLLRRVVEAAAPLSFGFVSTHWFGGGTHGLEATFLLMLTPLVVSGLVALVSFKTYARDVATADASTERLAVASR